MRRDLIEFLDRVVTYQRYHRQTKGHFTKVLSHLGVPIPTALSDHYAIHVVDSDDQRLLIEALSENNGRVADLILIDQDYKINANFPLPPPREAHLRVQALRHLRELHFAAREVPETGAYQGYFRYELASGAEQGQPFAVGIRSPVTGMRVELNSSSSSAIDIAEWNQDTGFAPLLTGEWAKVKFQERRGSVPELAEDVESVESLTRVSEISSGQPLEVEKITPDLGNASAISEASETVPEKAVSNRYNTVRSLAQEKESHPK